MRVSKWLQFSFVPGAALIFIICLCPQGSSTMILGSMLLGSMAANTAMLLGKMSLGGLMMMMLTQQGRDSGGGSGSGGAGQSLGQSLQQIGQSLAGLGQLGGLGRKRSTGHQESNPQNNQILGLSTNSNGKRTTRSHGQGGNKNPNKPNNNYPPQQQVPSQGYISSLGQHVPMQGQGHLPGQINTPLHVYGQEQTNQYQKKLYKRFTRSIVEELSSKLNSTVNPNESSSSTTTTTTTSEPLVQVPSSTDAKNSDDPIELVQDIPEDEAIKQIQTYTRLMRQADTFDYMSCLPKFVCGLEAQTPSKKTSILNDYSHLLKLMFGPDSDDDELDDDDDTDDDELGDDDDLSEEDIDNVDAYRIALQQKEVLDDAVNDKLIEENPAMLKYVLKDISTKGLKKPSKSTSSSSKDKKGGSSKKSSLKRRKIPTKGNKKGNGFRPAGNFGHYYNPGGDGYPPPPYGSYPPQQDEPQQESSGGFLSSLLPKVSAGFGTNTEDPDFDNDPFFSGFKRSLDAARSLKDTDSEMKVEAKNDGDNEVNVNDDEGVGANLKRNKRISEHSRRKREAVIEEMLDDPIIKKYEMAQQIGRDARARGNNGQRDCTSAFKKCPYDWNQIMGMMTNMRDAVLPKNGTAKQPDKVVVLQVPTHGGLNPASSATAFTKQGETSMTHDLGDGNVMQITLKLAPKVTGFEDFPIVEQEPYPINDELSLESLELIPHKPSTTTKPTTTTTNPEETQDAADDLVSEEEIEHAVQKFVSKNNGSWSSKPKRRYRPTPGSGFQFADDVDITAVKGGTILSPSGTDSEIKLKTKKNNSTSSQSSSKSSSKDDIAPIGSENSKLKKKQEAKKQYNENLNLGSKSSSNINVGGGAFEVGPAASYKDNNSDSPTTSEEADDDDDDDDNGSDDFIESAEDEFMLDDRKNVRNRNKRKNQVGRITLGSHNSNNNNNNNHHHVLNDEHQHPLPPQNFHQIHENHQFPPPPPPQGQILRPKPFPLIMRQPPVLYDESKDWLPIGETGRALPL